jgi:hypothetical protein
MPAQQGYVEFKMGGLTAHGRIRVAPRIGFKTDFDKAPPGSSPAGWVNTNGKFLVKKIADGNNVLSKVNNNARPPIAKAIAYITEPEAHDYTVRSDVRGGEVRGKLPDAGIVNSRYTLLLDGKPDPKLGRTLRITSWEARPRVNVTVPYDWQPDTWYTMKFCVEQKAKSALVRGKIWKADAPEPTDWTIAFEDPFPNRTGAAGIYGYIPNVQDNPDGTVAPGSDLYFDNLSITPNAIKK